MNKLIVLLVAVILIGGVVMASGLTEREQELLVALKMARSYLNGGDLPYNVPSLQAVYVTPAQALRNQADKIEQEERDVRKIDEIIRKYEQSQ